MSVTPPKNGTASLCICSVPFAISAHIRGTFMSIRDRRLHSRFFGIDRSLSALSGLNTHSTFLEKCIYDCDK